MSRPRPPTAWASTATRCTKSSRSTGWKEASMRKRDGEVGSRHKAGGRHWTPLARHCILPTACNSFGTSGRMNGTIRFIIHPSAFILSLMSLEGQFLVASRELLDPSFARAVVLLVQHTDEGAMGLVINRPTKTTLAEAWTQVSEAACPSSGLIYLGGPCRGPLMALHSDAEQSEIEVAPGLHFSADPDKIETLIGQAESPARFFIGFAGWGPGQLEAERDQDAGAGEPA